MIILYKEINFSDCRNGYFGVGCLKKCHCNEDSFCDDVSGNCSTGCAKGYTGSDCQEGISFGISAIQFNFIDTPQNIT